MKNDRVKTVARLGMLAAMAYAVMLVFHVPLLSAAPFLKYDAKDVVICIAGFLDGPLAGAAVSLVVALIEALTVGSSGFWGFLMNFLASAAFVCPASIIYRKIKGTKGVLLGLLSGVICMTAFMMLWNYIAVPIYQGWPREQVAGMLLPVFMPFNLLKGGINALITFLLFLPLRKILEKTEENA